MRGWWRATPRWVSKGQTFVQEALFWIGGWFCYEEHFIYIFDGSCKVSCLVFLHLILQCDTKYKGHINFTAEMKQVNQSPMTGIYSIFYLFEFLFS